MVPHSRWAETQLQQCQCQTPILGYYDGLHMDQALPTRTTMQQQQQQESLGQSLTNKPPAEQHRPAASANMA